MKIPDSITIKVKENYLDSHIEWIDRLSRKYKNESMHKAILDEMEDCVDYASMAADIIATIALELKKARKKK